MAAARWITKEQTDKIKIDFEAFQTAVEGDKKSDSRRHPVMQAAADAITNLASLQESNNTSIERISLQIEKTQKHIQAALLNGASANQQKKFFDKKIDFNALSTPLIDFTYFINNLRIQILTDQARAAAPSSQVAALNQATGSAVQESKEATGNHAEMLAEKAALLKQVELLQAEKAQHEAALAQHALLLQDLSTAQSQQAALAEELKVLQDELRVLKAGSPSKGILDAANFALQADNEKIREAKEAVDAQNKKLVAQLAKQTLESNAAIFNLKAQLADKAQNEEKSVPEMPRLERLSTDAAANASVTPEKLVIRVSLSNTPKNAQQPLDVMPEEKGAPLVIADAKDLPVVKQSRSWIAWMLASAATAIVSGLAALSYVGVVALFASNPLTLGLALGLGLAAILTGAQSYRTKGDMLIPIVVGQVQPEPAEKAEEKEQADASTPEQTPRSRRPSLQIVPTFHDQSNANSPEEVKFSVSPGLAAPTSYVASSSLAAVSPKTVSPKLNIVVDPIQPGVAALMARRNDSPINQATQQKAAAEKAALLQQQKVDAAPSQESNSPRQ